MKTWPTASYASFLHRNAAIFKPRGQRPSPQVGHSLPAQMPEMCVLGQAAVHHPPTFGTSGECACVKWSRFYFLCSGCVAVSRLSCWEFVTPRDAYTHKDAQQHLQGSGWEFWNWKYCLRCDFMLLSDYIWVKVSGLCKATEPWQSKTEPHSSLMPLLSLQKSAVQTDRTRADRYAGTHLPAPWCVSAQTAEQSCCHCLVPHQGARSACWCGCTAAWSPHCQSPWWKSWRWPSRWGRRRDGQGRPQVVKVRQKMTGWSRSNWDGLKQRWKHEEIRR